jgi:hypothetical protein
MMMYTGRPSTNIFRISERFLIGFVMLGLTVRPDKVKFATQEIAFLGHLVSPAGVRIDPDWTRVIEEFPPPRDVSGVSRFIGMVNFYHKFIPNVADVATPLNRLRRKGERFMWGPDQQKAFESLKHDISHTPPPQF